MALICKTTNGLESDFFEITSLWDVKQQWRHTLVTHFQVAKYCIYSLYFAPFLPPCLKIINKRYFPYTELPWHSTFVKTATKKTLRNNITYLKWFLSIFLRSVQCRISNLCSYGPSQCSKIFEFALFCGNKHHHHRHHHHHYYYYFKILKETMMCAFTANQSCHTLLVPMSWEASQ